MNKRIGLVTAGLVAGLVMVGGTAFAVSSSIPDSAGVIHGCYDSGGNVKVIDTSVKASCPKGYSPLDWSQTGPAGKDGKDGTNGTNAAPEFTWTISCASGGCAVGDAQTSIPDGIVLTPVAITVSAGTCSDPNPQNVLISDAGSHALASITWGAANSSTVDGPDTISAANGNVGVLHYIATGDCAFTITFTFDKTQSYS
jgi:hypothetical protein